MTPSSDSAPAHDPSGPVDGADLAALLAGKLCHDFISPAGAIVSGLDLLKDPTAQDMRDEAMGLIQSSADKLVALVHFARIAFGAATSAERFSAAELEPVVAGVFEGLRCALDWQVQPMEFSKPEARALVNLAQMAGGALPGGGVAHVDARVEGDELVLEALSEGPRARLKAEAVTGLTGARLAEGLPGQWIQPYWLWRTVTDAGGRLSAEPGEGVVRLTARIPRHGGR